MQRGLWLLLAGVLLAAGSCGGVPPVTARPAIKLTRIYPDSAAPGQAAFLLGAEGTGMQGTEQILWNGTPLQSEHLEVGNGGVGVAAEVPAALVAAGPAVVKVSVQGVGVTSNALSFGIEAPQQAKAGVIELVSVGLDGSPSDGDITTPAAISGTGRYVVFPSVADNLVPGPASGYADIFERDTCLNAPPGCVPKTIRVSVGYDGSLPNGHSYNPIVSDDGQVVVFASNATNLVPDDTQKPHTPDVFVAYPCMGAPAGCVAKTVRLSVTPSGGNPHTGPAGSGGGVISPDGRFAVFASGDDLIPGTPPSPPPYPPGYSYIWDSCRGATGACIPGLSFTTPLPPSGEPVALAGGHRFSANDRYVTIASYSTQLAPGSHTGFASALLRDTCFGAPAGCVPSYIPVSVSDSGAYNNGDLDAFEDLSVSADGRWAPFSSFASNLTPGPMIPETEVFLHDTCLGSTAPPGCKPSTVKVTRGFDGSPSNFGSGGEVISANGRFIAFDSLATNLIPGDDAAPATRDDIFVHDTCHGAPAGCVPSTVRVNVRGPGGQFPGESADLPARHISITADGKYLIFISGANNLLPSGVINTNDTNQVYLAQTGY